MKPSAVIIARFQTPYLHEGHKYLIDEIGKNHNKVIIVLGIAPVKGSRYNPFDFYTREKMLKQYSSKLIVLPLKDSPSDKIWSQQLDQLLTDSFPNEKFLLYGSRDSFITHYHGKLSVETLPEFGDYSATEIRNTKSDEVLDTQDFRLGVNYAYQNTYPKIYPTVDIALLRENKTLVLLGKKAETLPWRFPGGFADPEDESFEAAAKRELMEECGAVETGNFTYIGSVKIDDWRYRSEVDKIVTIFFRTELLYGSPEANDDLAFLQWFKISDLENMMNEGQVTKEHLPLFRKLLDSLR